MRWPTPFSAGMLALVSVMGAACGGHVSEPDGSGTRHLGPRYGISASLPAGWEGSLSRGKLVAEADDVLVRLSETARENRSPPTNIRDYPELTGELQFDADDFASWDGGTEDSRTTGHGYARRTFRLSERLFVLSAETNSRPPSPETLAQLNALLRSLEVAPGDFYPGLVESARFPARPGWHTGTSGVEEVDADGELTTAWASTVPYRDAWNTVPSRTLESLQPDGMVIWLWLTRSGRFPPSGPAFEPPIGLDTFERHEGWPGQTRPDIVLYRFTGRADDRQADLWVFFGRPDPTSAMRAEADAMLDGLELPDWGPWELEP